jgi:hypothetical protein
MKANELRKINKKWLLKFGFEKPKWADCYFIENQFICLALVYRNKEWLTHTDNSIAGCNFLTDKVQYVHQLQNLYFLLTGEELCTKVVK